MDYSLFDAIDSMQALQLLIESDQRESETLEYKTASHPLKEAEHAEIAKDVSALANSAGGLIVYGIATDKVDKTRPVALEAIDPGRIETILQVIATHVRHPIPGIRWKSLPEGATAQAFLIEVPPSPLAPHQVIKSFRYYRRNGAVSEPMSHDLVELYFGRRLGPVLELSVGAIKTFSVPRSLDLPISAEIDVYVTNVGQRVARDIVLVVTCEKGQRLEVFWNKPPASYIDGENTETSDTSGAQLTGVLIHPGLRRLLVTIFVNAAHALFDGAGLEVAVIEVHAEGMRAVRRRVTLSRSGEWNLTVALDE